MDEDNRILVVIAILPTSEDVAGTAQDWIRRCLRLNPNEAYDVLNMFTETPEERKRNCERRYL